MKKIWIFILFIVSVSFVFGDTVVKFIDGIFEIQKGSAWIELMPGDSIPDGSVLRVGENSIVELSSGKTKFSLTHSGIYNIDSIILNSVRSSKAKSLIFNTIRRLFGNQLSGQSPSQTSVFGVRAAEVPNDGFSWTNDEYAEYMESGKEYLQKADYIEAGLSFTNAMDVSFDDFETEEALFYLAYAEALSGDLSKALSFAGDLYPDYDAPYYEQAVLLKSNLLIENFAPEKAISWIQSQKHQAPGINGSLLLLEGLANIQLGKIETARELFQKVIKENEGSESAEIAAEYLDSM